MGLAWIFLLRPKKALIRQEEHEPLMVVLRYTDMYTQSASELRQGRFYTSMLDHEPVISQTRALPLIKGIESGNSEMQMVQDLLPKSPCRPCGLLKATTVCKYIV